MLHSRIDSCCIYTARLSSAVNRSSNIQYFECSDAIEICDGIIYRGLPHTCMYSLLRTWNQSMVQQLTREGNLRRRVRKASPMGLMASTT